MFVEELKRQFSLPSGRSGAQTNVYTVPDYVQDIYAGEDAREELLNILFGYFGQFELVTNRTTDLRSPLLDAQRVQALYAQGEYAKACELFESLTEPFPAGYARARGQLVYSAPLYYRGKSQEALDVALASLKELEAAGDTDNQVQLLNHIGGMHFTRLENEQATACYETVRELHEVSPVSIEAEAAAYWRLGSIELRIGDTAAAKPHHEAALAIYESLGYGVRAAWIRHNLGELALLDRRYEDALALMEPAERIFRDQPGHSGLLYLVNAQAKARYMVGDWQAVQASVQECLDIISQFSDEPTAPEVMLLVVLTSFHNRLPVDLESLSLSVIPRVLTGREETASVNLLRTALTENYSSTAIAAINMHLFGE